MSLTRKALTKTAITMLMMALALYLLARFSLADKINNLESDMALHNGTQVLSALNRDIEELDMIAGDWAQWDDTYNYVQSHNPEYPASNLVESTFQNNRLNFIMLFDQQGGIIYSKGYSWRDRKGEKIADGFQEYFTSFINQQGLKDSRGLLNRGGRLCIVTARAVYTSDGQTGPNGLLVMGRNLGEAEIQRLEDQTELEISINPYDGSSQLFTLAAGQSIAVVAYDEKTIRSYAPLNAIDNTQPAYLQVDMPRTLHQQGQTGMYLFVAGLLILALMCCLLILGILRNDILAPLQILAERVGVIGRLQDSAARVEFEGQGEMKALAEDINAMLERLEASNTGQQQSNLSLLEKEQQLQFILASMEQGFLAFGPELKAYPESSAACLRLLGQDPSGQDVSSLLCAGPPDTAFQWESAIKQALQAESPEKSAYYLQDLPSSLFINERALKLYYLLASGFKRQHPASIAVFVNDATAALDLEKEMQRQQGQLETLQALLGDARGFADLIDHYIYFYTKELPGWYESLESPEQAQKTARQAAQRLNDFAARFMDFQLTSTSAGLKDMEGQIMLLLGKNVLDSAGLTELASPERLESIIQADLSLVEDYLGEDLLRP